MLFLFRGGFCPSSPFHGDFSRCKLIRGGHADCYLAAPLERVHTIRAWLLMHLLSRVHEGGLMVQGATNADLHAWISDAMHAYEQCRSEPRHPAECNVVNCTCMLEAA